MKFSLLTCLFVSPLLCASVTYADPCQIQNSQGQPAAVQQDPLYDLLSNAADCPSNVLELKALMQKQGYTTRVTMLNNRGFNNPQEGLFSFIEEVRGTHGAFNLKPGQFFFGHFTSSGGGYLFLDRKADPSAAKKLLMELVVWNTDKGYYDFYELLGLKGKSQWFYRGDSSDILNDNANMYIVDPGGKPQLGQTLRCSACHSSGGPIMKELALPHNDWWRKDRPLKLGTYKVSDEVAQILKSVIDADDFSQSVKTGMASLETSSQYQQLRSKMSLPAQLRPLFCENEVNIEGDLTALNFASPVSANIQIPSGFFMNPLLGTGQFEMSSQVYKQLLVDNKMSFAKGIAHDSDHAWETPVKGYSDLAAIRTLINTRQVIDQHFALAVLLVDKQHPIFSADRCSLLKMLPNQLSADWKTQFQAELQKQNTPAANQLLENLKLTSDQLLAAADSDLKTASANLADPQQDATYFSDLLARRQSVFDGEISKNPLGQIFEPGFKILFPTTADAK